MQLLPAVVRPPIGNPLCQPQIAYLLAHIGARPGLRKASGEQGATGDGTCRSHAELWDTDLAEGEPAALSCPASSSQSVAAQAVFPDRCRHMVQKALDFIGRRGFQTVLESSAASWHLRFEVTGSLEAGAGQACRLDWRLQECFLHIQQTRRRPGFCACVKRESSRQSNCGKRRTKRASKSSAKVHVEEIIRCGCKAAVTPQVDAESAPLTLP